MSQEKKHRPFSLFLLVLVVLFFTIFNLGRALQAAQIWQALNRLVLVPPAYLLLSGLVWAMVGLGLALGLWRGWRNARLAALPVFGLYSAYFWLDRLALPGYTERNLNWPFMLAVNLLILGWTAWVLTRRKVKIFFGETHEQPTLEQPTRPEQLSGENNLALHPGEFSASNERDPEQHG